MRRNLDEVICYLEGTTMPPRLAEDETVTPAYETTTLGIGKLASTSVPTLARLDMPHAPLKASLLAFKGCVCFAYKYNFGHS